jgi:serine/threonine-protein kinase
VGETYDALMFAHLHSLPRDLRAVRPEVGKALASVVAKALSRDPARRYADLPAFLAAYREAAGLAAPARVGTAGAAPATGRGGPRRGDPLRGDPTPVPADERKPPQGEPRREGDRERPARGWWPFGRRRDDG